MKLTRADYKDALKDALWNLDCAIRDAAHERAKAGLPSDYSGNKAILEKAKIVALRDYLKRMKDAK